MNQSFALSVAGFTDELRVHGFQGEEALSATYSFDVRASISHRAQDPAEFLGRSVLLSFETGGFTRRFGGLIARATTIMERDDGRARFRLRVVPRLWRLRFKRRSRVFQNQRVDEVIASVLAEEGILSRWLVQTRLPTREYTTQFEETDYAFVRRLAAEAGLAWRFEPQMDRQPADLLAVDDAPVECLVFGDDTLLYDERHALQLMYQEHVGTVLESPHVLTRFDRSASMRTSEVTFRDYDPGRPGTPLISRAADPSSPLGLEHYEHHGYHHFPTWDVDAGPRLLKQKRRRTAVCSGASRSPNVAPGGVLDLRDLRSGDDGRYAPVRVFHEGRDISEHQSGPTYRNTFEAVPQSTFYPLPAPKRRNISGTMTAIVVGPEGSEIEASTDACVKVQFHWDREGTHDEKSSCWLRTMQAWAGAGWGSQFLPRVGMEVVVTFEGGDPDKPFILGALYNRTHPTPFNLASDPTRSGIRTQSTPQAEGFNELSFRDRAGDEQVYLRAQRDLATEVLNDHTVTVQRNHTETISGDEQTRVLGARTTETLGRRIEKTLAESELSVGGERRERFGSGRRVVVQGDDIQRTTGNGLLDVAKGCSVRAGRTLSLEAGTPKEPGTLDAFAWGSASIASNLNLRLDAAERVTISCGESVIELTKDTISLRAPNLRLAASKTLVATGDGPTLVLDKNAELTAESVRLYTEHASLELDREAHLDGELVKLACSETPNSVADVGAQLNTQPLKLVLKDHRFEPHAHKPFVVRAAGARIEGTTNASGEVDVRVPLEARAAEITMWLGKRAASESRRYLVTLEAPAAATTLRGVQQRLQHLGFFHHTPCDEATEDAALDEPTRIALRELQTVSGLQPHGELCDATRAKLVELHGN